MASLHRILVATDFTETSSHAIDWAIELAARLGSAVTILHAYEIPVIAFPEGGLIATAEVAARLSDTATEALNKTVESYQGRGVPVDGLLREGMPSEEINAAAEQLDADIIVIGTHGRRGLARALLGSVAETVIRTAHRPVMSIHAA
jgi:nucleotide-binding universal stress UspA family protein